MPSMMSFTHTHRCAVGREGSKQRILKNSLVDEDMGPMGLTNPLTKLIIVYNRIVRYFVDNQI